MQIVGLCFLRFLLTKGPTRSVTEGRVRGFHRSQHGHHDYCNVNTKNGLIAIMIRRKAINSLLELVRTTTFLILPPQQLVSQLNVTSSMSSSVSSLFQPLRVGTINLQHRVVMAPLTRHRADKDHVHGDLAKTYYTQRSSVPGTLIITEGTFIAPQAAGYPNVPGIWSDAQIAAWKSVCISPRPTITTVYTDIPHKDYRCRPRQRLLHLPPALGSWTHCRSCGPEAGGWL